MNGGCPGRHSKACSCLIATASRRCLDCHDGTRRRDVRVAARAIELARTGGRQRRSWCRRGIEDAAASARWAIAVVAIGEFCSRPRSRRPHSQVASRSGRAGSRNSWRCLRSFRDCSRSGARRRARPRHPAALRTSVTRQRFHIAPVCWCARDHHPAAVIPNLRTRTSARHSWIGETARGSCAWRPPSPCRADCQVSGTS